MELAACFRPRRGMLLDTAPRTFSTLRAAGRVAELLLPSCWHVRFHRHGKGLEHLGVVDANSRALVLMIGVRWINWWRLLSGLGWSATGKTSSSSATDSSANSRLLSLPLPTPRNPTVLRRRQAFCLPSTGFPRWDSSVTRVHPHRHPSQFWVCGCGTPAKSNFLAFSLSRCPLKPDDNSDDDNQTQHRHFLCQ